VRVLGYLVVALAGGTVPVLALIQAVLAAGELRLGLLAGWLLRREAGSTPVLPHRGAIGAGVAGLLALLIAVRVGVFRRLAARIRAGRPAGLDQSHRDSAEWTDRVPPRTRTGPPATAKTACWDGAQPPTRRRARQDPTGAVVIVTSITGSVGRATLAGRPCTVCSTGPRLRPGTPYVVLARDGDVLVVATPATPP
jgi:hypothetical protein